MSNWRPLVGTTVIDLTRMLPGGTATMLLADLGARVIKVERPGDLDATRYLAPRVGPDSSVQHQYLDRGKESVELDLRDDGDRARLLELVAGADAIIDSFRPGVMARLGLGPDVLLTANPEITAVSLSGYGQNGPRADFAGHDLNFVGRAGLLSPGTKIPEVFAADLGGGLLAALAIAAGVARARVEGRGGVVDLALADAAMVIGGMSIAQELGAATLAEEVRTPLDGFSPCYAVYRTSDDGRIAVAAVEPKFWLTTVELLGHPEWAARQTDPALVADMQDLFATNTLEYWTSLLERPDTCVTAVNSVRDLPKDAQHAARGALLDHPSPAGPLPQVASPFRDLTPDVPPQPGQETR
ncbi:CaiB/BaiF CoA-transferase family protein [Streptomyces sp. NPDC046805]|uniref:CaiB/BaiF CoA transferase family protein n=1 Tax=Streptomyces sp. NPDC046805 TaxID=3155134 RepID=UPI00340FA4D4